MSGELRRAIAAVDPDQPVLELRSLDQVVADRAGGITHLARVLTAMSTMALLLALMGIYSVIAYVASRRRQEFGVRIALGATRWQVIRLSLKHALVVTVLGLGFGALPALAISRVMRSSLFGLVSIDAGPIAMMVVALGAVALAAGYLPARTAADVDPATTLKIL